MPTYEIVETPGKEVVYPGPEDVPPRTQDEAKIVMQRLRAEAKVEGRQVDFIIRATSGPGARPRGEGGNAAAATSVRLTEENRAKVARFCGRMMMETGVPMTMGDAVARLIDHHDATSDAKTILADALERATDNVYSELAEMIVGAARQIRMARKAAAEGSAA